MKISIQELDEELITRDEENAQTAKEPINTDVNKVVSDRYSIEMFE
jgi:hypothetical protein